MIPSRRARSQQDGAATVEMAVLMIIFIPLVLFTMYMSDAVFHTLEVQEAVVVTTWDLTQQQYSREPKPAKARSEAAGWIDGTLAAMDRLQYADHIGEYASDTHINGDGRSFSDDTQHHIQLFGHVCWCNGGFNCSGQSDYGDGSKSQNIHCNLDQGTTHNLYANAGALYYSQTAGAGGVVTCSAKGWLYNYLIPETFLAGFGDVNKVKLFNKKKQSASTPHDISSEGDKVGGDMLLKFRDQIFIDTWAVVDGSNIDRTNNDNMVNLSSIGDAADGGIGPNEAYFRRAAVVFTNPAWYANAVSKVRAYKSKASQKKLLDVPLSVEAPILLGIDGLRTGPNPTQWAHTGADNPVGFTISVQFPVTSTDAGGFYTTPYYDTLRSMYSNRRSFYMGFTQQKKTYN